MTGRARRAWPWLAVAGWCALVFALSSMSSPLPPGPWNLSDKLLHAVGYAAGGALLALALSRSAPRLGGPALALAAALGVAAYGATDEWHQSFVPGRVADVRDWLADLAGGALGAAAAAASLRRARSAG